MHAWKGVSRTRRLLRGTLEHGGIPWVRQQCLRLTSWRAEGSSVREAS